MSEILENVLEILQNVLDTAAVNRGLMIKDAIVFPASEC